MNEGFGATNLSPSQAGTASTLGRVIAVKGSSVGVSLDASNSQQRATVGTFVGIVAGAALLVGMITDLEQEHFSDGSPPRTKARLDLLGEIVSDATGSRRFRRGVAGYPVVGDEIQLIAGGDLRAIFESEGADRVRIGTLQQAPSISVSLDASGLVSKHFAVLGTTGVGKSSGLALILREIMQARRDLRIFLLDGHNEYGAAFGDRANVIGSRDLKLPFWLFNFEEVLDVIFGGRPPVPEEVEILAELIPLAKAGYDQHRVISGRVAVKRAEPRNTALTVDTPVPYVLQDLLALIDDRMGRLENRSSRMHYHRLTMRLETIRNDPRYGFMFENANVGGDIMGDLLTYLFRLDSADRPISVMQLAGLPVEVVDAVVCVLCRMAFDLGLWSEGRFPLLLVCEEAHRYVAADRTIGFNPTRRAISRIAKEGRKYGIFLGLVTQRPAELDSTVISQCGTLIAMRMANDADQALLRSAVSDAAASLMDFLPSLGTREAIGFGEGFLLPARFVFNAVPTECLPRPETIGGGVPVDARELIRVALESWRGATMRSDRRRDADHDDNSPGESPRAPAQTAAIEHARQHVLRRGPEGTGIGSPAPESGSNVVLRPPLRAKTP